MNKFEQPEQTGVDPEIIEQIREQFAEEWENIVTGEGTFDEEDFGYVEKIKNGGKVPMEHKWLHDMLIRIGQDRGMNVREVDYLIETFLE